MICKIGLMLPGGSRITCTIHDVWPGLHLYVYISCTTYIKAGSDLDDLSVEGLSSLVSKCDRHNRSVTHSIVSGKPSQP